MTSKLLLGDCLEILKTLPDNSVDSLVTDPPAGISFMGKDWDSAKGGRKEWIAWMADVMRECLRVMKPGAHGLVWAIPRTSHWTATALEDAGFEVRDVITHLFGQGFPKSLDISKAIDKAAGAEREVVGGRKLQGKARQMKGGNFLVHENRNETDWVPFTAPATDAAKQWAGWGTALKPASEHWILVRKPCEEKTVAANVLEWGVGGINIDGCRIETNGPTARPPLSTNKHEGWVRPWNDDPKARNECEKRREEAHEKRDNLGRFPANLVLSHSPYCTDDQCDIECAIERLNGQSGISKSSDRPRHCKARQNLSKGMEYNRIGFGHADFGGASRFFYCAKISPGERGKENNHPTVKPQKLMSYFCRLVTPPGGIVLDPFMGSGSTGLAAKGEGFQFIGIEKDPGYFEISTRRIDG